MIFKTLRKHKLNGLPGGSSPGCSTLAAKKEKYLSSNINEVNYCAIPFPKRKVNLNFGSGIQ